MTQIKVSSINKVVCKFCNRPFDGDFYRCNKHKVFICSCCLEDDNSKYKYNRCDTRTFNPLFKNDGYVDQDLTCVLNHITEVIDVSNNHTYSEKDLPIIVTH